MTNTNKTAGHTPLPWELSDVRPWRIQCQSRGEVITDVFGSEKSAVESAANAAFIVRAANSHAALVAALRLAAQHMLEQAAIAERFRHAVQLSGRTPDTAAKFESLRNQMNNGAAQCDAALAAATGE